ncbi:hypothetical protein [Leptospira haakeii]|uniref:Lipoprotein n=1 Tax=Leptospira haakeii TaxID=2023198 RepID=A0ABX4PH69_9LEPT|nr:hypothetical protein [Leptospira haakeii]PKA15089.1 hypothetical protein CH363_14590 [Leptospira haakeii]PKA20237.1 hypothetical protein CH377_08125 [Leptospira haakeii]
MKFKFATITLVFLLSFLGCSSLSTKAPFYNSPAQKNSSTEWKLELVDLGFYRKVGEDWWGEDFYIATFKATNLMQKTSYFELCGSKLEDYYKSKKPEMSADELKSLIRRFSEMRLLVQIDDTSLWPKNVYGSKPVFPKIQNEPKPIFAAAMTGCQYGIPMSRDTDKGRTGTERILPGESGTVKAIYSIPKGSKFIRFEQTNFYQGNLEPLNIQN